MTGSTAFKKSRMLNYINEKMNFFEQVEKITRIMAIITSYFRVIDKILRTLYSFALTGVVFSRIELFLAIESTILLVLSLVISLKIEDLYKEEPLSKLYALSIFNGLFIHIIFGEINLISLSLTISFLTIHEIIELIQKRFYFSKSNILIEEESDLDTALILMLKRYIEDRVQWIATVSIILAIVNLVIYIGTFLTPLYNSYTTTISIIVLFIFGVWMFFTTPNSD